MELLLYLQVGAQLYACQGHQLAGVLHHRLLVYHHIGHQLLGLLQVDGLALQPCVGILAEEHVALGVGVLDGEALGHHACRHVGKAREHLLDDVGGYERHLVVQLLADKAERHALERLVDGDGLARGSESLVAVVDTDNNIHHNYVLFSP